LNINQLSGAPLPSRAFISQYCTEQVPEEAKISSPEVQGSEFAVPSLHSPKDICPGRAPDSPADH